MWTLAKFYCAGMLRKRADGTPYCEHSSDVRWGSFCPACGRPYNIITRKPPGENDRMSLASLAMAKPPVRMSTGSREFDYVLGGGIVPGATIVLTGPPGSGKSTVLIQTADAIARAHPSKCVLYTSGEQNSADVGLIAARLKLESTNIDVLGNEGDAYKITAAAERRKPVLLIVDSVQTAFISDTGGDCGSSEQIKAVTNWLTSFGKVEKVAVILVSHVTKDNSLAGPRAFEHLVDGICYLDPYEILDEKTGEPDPECKALREFSIGKNRYGPPGLTAVVEMTELGLHPPSKNLSQRIILSAG